MIGFSQLHQNLDLVSVDHLLQMHTQCISERSKIVYDTQYLDGLELVKILMSKQISLTSYSDFMKFKHGTKNHHKYYSLHKLVRLSQQRVLGKSLAKRMKPMNTNLVCPSGRKVSIITFDIDIILYELLSNEKLNQKKKL